MIYEYETQDGQIVEIVKPAANSDRIGKVITHNGEKVTRIASATSKPTSVWKPYVSSRLPRFAEGCDHTAQGKPIITTQAQERNVAARLGWERE